VEGYHYLFQDCFPETAGTSLESPEHYRWKYGPEGKDAPAFEFAAYEDERLLGYYAALPFAYLVEGKPRLAAMVCDVMTHSAARGRGIFTAQGRHATECMGQNGVAFCTGYPIRNYVFPGHVKIGWRIAFPLPVYFKLLDPRPVLAAWRAGALGSILRPLCSTYQRVCRLTRPRLAEVWCKQLDPNEFFSSPEYVSFYENWASNCDNHLIRTGRFFRWRLNAPETSYTVTALYSGTGVVGLAVTRPSKVGGFPVTCIVEFMLLPEHRTLAGAIHDELARLSRQNATAGLVVMATRSNAHRWMLFRNGYFKSNVEFKLILKWLAADPTPASFWDESAWHLTWLDTDNL
jgi:Acetyltransferase (GNAT) domain